MQGKTIEKLFLLGRPLSPVYSAIMKGRAHLYEKGVLKGGKIAAPVISVGNISLGGTGKTPHVMEIARFLRKSGYTPAIISRGYGGRAGKGPLVVTDGKRIFADVSTCGDEPYMMAMELKGIPIVVGSNRCASASYAIKHLKADSIILDDGFQHLALRRDIDIVLLPSRAPFGNQRVFPGGDLREPISGLKRANCLILTKCNEITEAELQIKRRRIQELFPAIPVFESRYLVESIELPFKGTTLPLNEIKEKIFIFCGIANPFSFIEIFKKAGIETAGYRFFKDHFQYDSQGLKKLFEEAKKSGCSLALTTAKDFAKITLGDWEHFAQGLELGVVHLLTDIQPSFWKFLAHSLSYCRGG